MCRKSCLLILLPFVANFRTTCTSNSGRVILSKAAVRLQHTQSAAAEIQRRSQDMHFDLRQAPRVVVALVLATVFALPQNLAAETASHLVSPSELQQAAVKASAARQQNRDEVQQFFSSEPAQKALQSAHMNPQQVKAAIY